MVVKAKPRLVISMASRSLRPAPRAALADALARATSVIVAGTGAARADRARFVVHVVFHGKNSRFAIARARVEPTPGFVQVGGAQEAGGLVLGKHQRALGHGHRVGEG